MIEDFDWNSVNNALSDKVLQADALDGLLESLGCQTDRWYGDTVRFPCPVHVGDSPNLTLKVDGDQLPVRWACYSHNCHLKFKPSLLGLVRGILSARHGKPVNMRDAVRYIKEYLKSVPVPPGCRPILRSTERKTFSMTREQVRARLCIPSAYFLERGFSPEVLDEFDVGHSDKLRKTVIPLYDPKGEFCVGYKARSEYPYCQTCQRCHPPENACGYGQHRWLVSSGFPRESYLFNLARAKATDSPFIFLVEGIPDVLKLAMAGYVGVALLGSDASNNQVQLLRGLGRTIIAAFDNDEPGTLAFNNLKKLSKSPSLYFPLKMFSIPPDYKDVGEMPPEELREAIEANSNQSEKGT